MKKILNMGINLEHKENIEYIGTESISERCRIHVTN